MGLDVDAYIFVGLTVDKFNIREMPLYEEGMGWRDLGEVYYYSDDMSPLKIRDVHVDADNDQRVLGIEIAYSGSWSVLKIDFEELQTKIKGACARFKEVIGKQPEVLLMPRMW